MRQAFKKNKLFSDHISLSILLPALACFIAMVVTAFPIISGNTIGNNCSAQLYINGYNLAEFSGYGFIVILTPLILLNVHHSKLSFHRRILAILTIWTAYLTSYGLGILAGKEWLTSLESNIPITYGNIQSHAGLWLIPIATLHEEIVLILCYFCKKSRRYCTENTQTNSKVHGGTYHGNLQTRKTEQIQSLKRYRPKTARKAWRIPHQRRFRYYRIHR